MKKIVSLILVIALASVLLTGCLNSAANTSAPAAAESNAATYNLVYQCAWGTGGGPYDYASDLSKAIVAASGGRVTMDCLATDSVVSTADMLEAVGNGTLDCAQTVAVNFPDDSLGILSTIPVGMTFDEYMGWYVAGEGRQILDEVMLEINPDVVAIPCGVVDSEILYHSTTPITSLEDLKGLKVRGLSDWAKIETMLGAAVVNISGGDCYEGLSRGTIDACEYSSPFTNYSAGFHEVAPYMTVPGIHNSSAAYLLLINRNVWEGMDEQIKSIIELACTAMMAQNWAEDRLANGQAWTEYQKLVDEGKLTIYRLSDEDIQTIKDTAAEYYASKCAENALFAKVYESQMNYIETVSAWSAAAQP